MKLKPKELCPIHKRYNCCGRETSPARYGRVTPALKYRIIAPGVRLYPDETERCSKSALDRRKKELLAKHPYCAACHEKFDDCRDVELSHRVGKGLGGGKHNDHRSNLVLLHKSANREQGSKPLHVYLAERGERDCLK